MCKSPKQKMPWAGSRAIRTNGDASSMVPLGPKGWRGHTPDANTLWPPCYKCVITLSLRCNYWLMGQSDWQALSHGTATEGQERRESWLVAGESGGGGRRMRCRGTQEVEAGAPLRWWGATPLWTLAQPVLKIKRQRLSPERGKNKPSWC